MARKRRNRRSRKKQRHRQQQNDGAKESQLSQTVKKVAKNDSSTLTMSCSSAMRDMGVQVTFIEDAMAKLKFTKCDLPQTQTQISVSTKSMEQIFSFSAKSVDNREGEPSQTSVWLSLQGSTNTLNTSQESLFSVRKSFNSPTTTKSNETLLLLRKSRSRLSSVSKPRKFNGRTLSTRVVKVAKRKDPEVPKSFSPQHLTLNKSANLFGLATPTTHFAFGGISLTQRMRVLHEKYTHKLLQRFLSICSFLGLTFKIGLLKVCSRPLKNLKLLAKNDRLVECASCAALKLKIETLEGSLLVLNKEFAICKEQVGEIEALRREIADVKLLIKNANGCRAGLTGAPPPPPPPFPTHLSKIPPPPPLPPVTMNGALSNKLKLASNNKFKEHEAMKKASEDARPIISVDDILKVKLKKAGDRDRPATSRVNSPRTQPMVSIDMLKQVKLKPASRATPGGCCGSASMLKTTRLAPDAPGLTSLAHVLARKSDHNASRLEA